MAVPAAEGFAVTALRSVVIRVRIVAVSKTKPVSLVREVYNAGHRCFGENYVQEMVEKAPQMPKDVEWHFVGHLQGNKVKTLLSGVPNLAMCEGIDNEKIANHLERAVSSLGRNPLKVLVQVNTSGEVSKSGVEPANCVELAKHVKLNCPNLTFSGLMTIGMPDCASTPANFKALGIAEEQCELSMGMSGDFEQADIYELGARRIAVFNAPPMGCVSSQRTSAGGSIRDCAEDYNQAPQLFNAKLSSHINYLDSRFPDSKMVYIDIYSPLLDLTLHLQNYGRRDRSVFLFQQS